MVTVDTSADISGSSPETSVDSRSTVDRVTINISTDASVNVSVKVCYKIHDPGRLRQNVLVGRQSEHFESSAGFFAKCHQFTNHHHGVNIVNILMIILSPKRRTRKQDQS